MKTEADELIANVVREYMRRIAQTCSIPQGYADTIETDLREEVLEMFRKKTYGHYSLSSFRKAQNEKANTEVIHQPREQDSAPSRRQRRLS
jgi:hypothetical protein